MLAVVMLFLSGRSARSLVPTTRHVVTRLIGGAATTEMTEATTTQALAVPEVKLSGAGLEAASNVDLVLVPVFKDDKFEMSEAGTTVDTALGGALSELLDESFEGKPGSSTALRLQGGNRLAAIVVSKDKPSAPAVGKTIASLSKTHKVEKVGIVHVDGLDITMLTQSALEALYVDNRFRTGDAVVDAPPLAEIVVLGGDAPTDVIGPATAIAKGVALARDVVNAPANVVTPASLAAAAMALTETYPTLSGKVLDEAECARRGMGAFLGVSKGSMAEHGAHFIHLTYKGPKKNAENRSRLAFVGKGLTYDSGGYNLKPSVGGMIEKMKFDMGGAAAVLGAAKAIAELEIPDLDVDIIVAACENMVSAEAMRPGDILTASNGKTIEVINTDAEGRLTLADALIYAETECKPDAIVDLATLTGAMIIALGENIAGLFTPHDDLATDMLDASKNAGEKLWRMPLEADYEEAIKSKIADLKNVGGRPAGSITAGLFLKHFVSKDLPWCHLDIAGPVWDSKNDIATGFGVKTLVALATARGG